MAQLGNTTVFGNLNVTGDVTQDGAGLAIRDGITQVNLDADMADGLHVHTGTNNVANRIVRTDGSGYLYTGYINCATGDENNASNADRVWGTNGTDSFLRTYRTGALSVAYAGDAGKSRLVSSPDVDRNPNNTLPSTSPHSVRYDFSNSAQCGTGGTYAGVMTYAPYDGTTASTGDASYQLAFGSTAINGGGTPMLRIRKGIDSTWNSWYDVWTTANLPQPTSTGSATFTTGTTHTVTNAFITTSTYVMITPTGTKNGDWSVVSYAGYFTITSTASESSVAFDWGAIK